MQRGTVVGGRFTIEREAGAGGMGTVYEAHDAVTGERVALKVLARGSSVDTARFLREARALASADHPAIVRYVTHGTTDAGAPFLAMEWLDGVDLATRLSARGLSTNDTLRVVKRTAEALGSLHRHGVIHRDVKPSNVFLVGDDVEHVKLLDLGVARLGVGSDATITRVGSIVGTPGYMAPEQVRGESDLTPRADVFALGCILYECLTGQPAFRAEHAIALLAKILLADAPRARDVRSDVPAGVDELCAAMLAKDAAKRPADGAEVARAIVALEDPNAIGDAPSPRAAKPSTPALTTNEDRLVCVLLASDRHEATDVTAATVSTDTIAPEHVVAVQARVAATGLRIERLVDGSLVGVPRRDANAAEQSLAVARAALLLRATLPRAPMAIATGRGDVSTPLPIGVVIDRAVALLRASRRSSPPPIAIDDVTSALLADRFEIDTRGEERALVAERSEGLATNATLLGKETPFVGREREMSLIADLLGECIEEPAARAVVVTAPPGGGKSRLRREAVANVQATAPNAVVWLGRGDAMTAGSPFSLLGRMLRDGARLGSDDAASHAKLRAHFAALGIADVETTLYFASRLAGVAVAAETPEIAAARRDPQVMNDRLRAVWHAWLAAELAAHPVVLVLEDLHWGDAPTVSFVDDALRSFADRPLFVLALARPEVDDVFPKLWSERGIQPLPLRDLSKKASETIARHALGARADEGVVTEIARRAMGNPFFLEELLRSTEDRSRVGLPESVLALVEARLDGLDPDARRVLRAASVFGETFHAGGVRALLGEGALDLGAWLDVLVRRESIVPRPTSSIAGEAEYAFRHALVRDAAYAMLTEHDRTLGHALAAAWLESNGVRDPVLLAEHYQLGNRAGEAARWFVAAAEARMSANDFAGVLEATKRGLACATSRDDRAALLLLRAEGHRWRTDYDAVMTSAREVLSLADARSAPWWSAMAAMIEAEAKTGLVKEASERAAEIEAEAAATGKLTREHIVACAGAASTFVDYGHYARADALLATCNAGGAALLAADALLEAEVSKAHARVELARGDIGAFTKRMIDCHASYERVGAFRYAALGLSSAAYGAMLVGRYEAAIEGLERGVRLSVELGAINGIVVSKHNLGYAYLRVGRREEALAVEGEAVEAARVGKHRRMLGACLYYMSLIRHDLGDFAGAEKEALESAEVCADVPPSLAEALAAVAQARLSKSDLPGALESSREAKRILDEVGGIDEGEPFIRLVAAKVLHATGAIDEACLAIVEARTCIDARAANLGDDETRASFYRVCENAEIVELGRAWAQVK